MEIKEDILKPMLDKQDGNIYDRLGNLVGRKLGSTKIKEPNSTMNIITINFATKITNTIDRLVKNRSEFIRNALEDYLTQEINFKENLNEGNGNRAGILTVNVSNRHLEMMDYLLEDLHLSRSELVRHATYTYLKKQMRKEEIEEIKETKLLVNGKLIKVSELKTRRLE